MLAKISSPRCATAADGTSIKALLFFYGDGPRKSSGGRLRTGRKLTFNLSLHHSNNGSSVLSKKLLIYCFQDFRLSCCVVT
jgi:hypothetical protein